MLAHLVNNVTSARLIALIVFGGCSPAPRSPHREQATTTSTTNIYELREGATKLGTEVATITRQRGHLTVEYRAEFAKDGVDTKAHGKLTFDPRWRIEGGEYELVAGGSKKHSTVRSNPLRLDEITEPSGLGAAITSTKPRPLWLGDDSTVQFSAFCENHFVGAIKAFPGLSVDIVTDVKLEERRDIAVVIDGNAAIKLRCSGARLLCLHDTNTNRSSVLRGFESECNQ